MENELEEWIDVSFGFYDDNTIFGIVFSSEQEAAKGAFTIQKWKDVVVHIVKRNNGTFTFFVVKQDDEKNQSGAMFTRPYDTNGKFFTAFQKRLQDNPQYKYVQCMFREGNKTFHWPKDQFAVIPLRDCLIHDEMDFQILPMPEPHGTE